MAADTRHRTPRPVPDPRHDGGRSGQDTSPPHRQADRPVATLPVSAHGTGIPGPACTLVPHPTFRDRPSAIGSRAMTTLTPFARLLKETADTAAQNPDAAFARLDELYGKSSAPAEVLQLGTFAAHLGGATLGRWEPTAAFLNRLVAHPGAANDATVVRSIWRAIAVMHRCGGRSADADAAAKQGCNGPGDTCRLALMTGHTLAARGRTAEALPFLREAAKLVKDLDARDEAVAMAATVAGNLMRVAEQQVRLAHEMLSTVTDVHQAALDKHGDWRVRHRALFQTGQARLLAAQPGAALATVQAMMALEDASQAGPLERFFTAALACRAQHLRGQDRVAQGALEACRDYAKRIEQADQQAAVQPLLKDLEAALSRPA